MAAAHFAGSICAYNIFPGLRANALRPRLYSAARIRGLERDIDAVLFIWDRTNRHSSRASLRLTKRLAAADPVESVRIAAVAAAWRIKTAP
jgi:hypothetical protein